MYYVYVLKRVKDDLLYYGYTSNLERRVTEHKKDWDCELVYFEAHKAEVDARKRERKLKDYGQALNALKLRLKESLK